jgi:hypothetical protein
MRLALFYDTSVEPSDAVSLESSALNNSFLVEAGVVWDNIVAAGLSIAELKNQGFANSIEDLQRLGMDTLEVASNSSLARELVVEYGSDPVRERLLVGPQDAVHLAGSVATTILNIDPAMLIDLCAGSPEFARVVIVRLGHPEAVIQELTLELLLNTGLRGRTLRNIGFTTVRVAENLPRVTPDGLRRLGLVEFSLGP